MKLEARVNVEITRANGRKIKIGLIKGGRWYERVIPQIRLWLANRQARRGGK